jgi:hypothetical protein
METLNIHISKIVKAFKAEDDRLAALPETEENGNPFTICTNGARWIKEQFFPNAKVVGYQHDKNPTAEIGLWTCGHDFLVIEGRYILDLWYRYITGDGDRAPILLDIHTQPALVKRYYGDINKWKEFNEQEGKFNEYKP